MNEILDRAQIVHTITDMLHQFKQNVNSPLAKRGIYIYGKTGIGKTRMVCELLSCLNYDCISFDAGDIRNKTIIESIDNTNMANRNIMSLFDKKTKPLAIIMDEIDGINIGDKGGINALIKLIRPKKTKKQLSEKRTTNPIICIGNYHFDKKLKELMGVCEAIEIPCPTNDQISQIIAQIMPQLEATIIPRILQYIQGDLRKINTVHKMYKKDPSILKDVLLNDIFVIKSYNDDIRNITRKLLTRPHSIDEHNLIMNNTDRTSVGLLWHENIIDLLDSHPKQDAIVCYSKILNNICAADYIDRVRFQNQIWQFNEMGSLIKTFTNCKIYHEAFPATEFDEQMPIRFTKILTKFATEFNNMFFVNLILCQKMGVNKQTMCVYLLNLKNLMPMDEIYQLMMDKYEIKKLEVNRIYRYLSKYINNRENADVDDDLSGEIFEDDMGQ